MCYMMEENNTHWRASGEQGVSCNVNNKKYMSFQKETKEQRRGLQELFSSWAQTSGPPGKTTTSILCSSEPRASNVGRSDTWIDEPMRWVRNNEITTALCSSATVNQCAVKLAATGSWNIWLVIFICEPVILISVVPIPKPLKYRERTAGFDRRNKVAVSLCLEKRAQALQSLQLVHLIRILFCSGQVHDWKRQHNELLLVAVHSKVSRSHFIFRVSIAVDVWGCLRSQYVTR